MSNWLGRAISYLLVLGALVWAAPAAQAQEELPPNDGPVFLIVSLNRFPLVEEGGDGTFASGTPVTMVAVGTLVGGGAAVGDARFILDAALPTVPLPTTEGFTLSNLNGNQATILGSFQTTETTDPAHLISPAPAESFEDGIPPEIQQAFFNASRTAAFAALLPSEGEFPTTTEIAEVVYAELGETSHTVADVEGYLFATDMIVNATVSTCDAEGGLFPHDPGPAQFDVKFDFGADGTFGTFDLCLIVEATVPEAAINLKKNGVLNVTIHATDTFDTDDIDEDTVEIGGVFPTKVVFSANKAICTFSVQELAVDVLTTDTTEVTINAFLSDGSCIEGTAEVNIKK